MGHAGHIVKLRSELFNVRFVERLLPMLYLVAHKCVLPIWGVEGDGHIDIARLAGRLV
ncbi:hypothetical protein O979_09145 [Mycobacterium avium subsp. paratuberculosis 10-4404]|nr:hypothetical protein D522_13660 [Mycobacterium avium subsp. paratuberculosis S5]ETB03476.1 hypothetical protein O979_09145 [Mycobacterium avium subsp. paratuberculosis 10-4404]ETB04900.1 hypothetical protein O978_09180 [Mycobacterium avium subsp. paratuberculosis 10-5864]ETB12512.1 hypothetical protein O980_08815 [Mycobacterium avium subsp. paratuberculosis 08-8281]ETB33201.1 hypothetical protein O977_09775 [Mycobacterium avium subsp. paratuberculosis 10-5975]ETB40703.1 hypothetical protein